MDMIERVEILEKEVKDLSEEIKNLKRIVGDNEESEFEKNAVDEYMIKLVYNGIYSDIIKDPNKITIGFPSNRKKLASKILIGQFMFIYVTSPVKKIIGLTRVISKLEQISKDDRWPYTINAEWVIRPKQGIQFKEVGLDIRPRVGDTLYSITEEKAHLIIDKLKAQNDLSEETMKCLSNID